jgi:hypothetical protein
MLYTKRILQTRKSKMKRIYLAIPIILGILLAGCSTTAQIRDVFGITHRGQILGSDEDNVYISEEYFNEIQPISKDEIANVQHPGLVRGILWSVVGGYGVANIVVGVPQISDTPPGPVRTGFTIGVFLPASLGIPLAYEGFNTYQRSKAALKRPYTPKQ